MFVPDQKTNGQIEKTVKMGMVGIDGKTLTFNLADNKVNFEVKEGRIESFPSNDVNYKTPWEGNPKAIDNTKTITMSEVETINEKDGAEAIARVKELHNQREKAEKDFVVDMTLRAAKNIPYVSSVAGHVKQVLYDGDMAGVVSGLVDDIPGVGTVKGIYESISAHSEHLAAIDSEISAQQSSVYDDLFDASSVVVNSSDAGDTDKVISSRLYDLESTLWQYDLEKNGLQSYIYRYERSDYDLHKAKSVEEAQKSVEDFIAQYPSDSDASHLLKGNSGLVIEDDGQDREKDGKVSSQATMEGLQDVTNDSRIAFFNNEETSGYKNWRDFNSNYFGQRS